jgi:hypothetical protein
MAQMMLKYFLDYQGHLMQVLLLISKTK